jgi:aspartate carbamoyltransferase catalytic subunit
LQNPDVVHFLCGVAGSMARIVGSRGGCSLLAHRVLANVFYEPSTRTSCSFASAMQRLGGTVLQVAESSSSAAKGETLGDSVRALACYSEVVVLRHPAKGAAAEASAACPVPLLNAGDGVGEHPTQALLDFCTIHSELGGVAGATVSSSEASPTYASSARAPPPPPGEPASIAPARSARDQINSWQAVSVTTPRSAGRA